MRRIGRKNPRPSRKRFCLRSERNFSNFLSDWPRPAGKPLSNPENQFPHSEKNAEAKHKHTTEKTNEKNKIPAVARRAGAVCGSTHRSGARLQSHGCATHRSEAHTSE